MSVAACQVFEHFWKIMICGWLTCFPLFSAVFSSLSLSILGPSLWAVLSLSWLWQRCGCSQPRSRLLQPLPHGCVSVCSLPTVPLLSALFQPLYFHHEYPSNSIGPFKSIFPCPTGIWLTVWSQEGAYGGGLFLFFVFILSSCFSNFINLIPYCLNRVNTPNSLFHFSFWRCNWSCNFIFLPRPLFLYTLPHQMFPLPGHLVAISLFSLPFLKSSLIVSLQAGFLAAKNSTGVWYLWKPDLLTCLI